MSMATAFVGGAAGLGQGEGHERRRSLLQQKSLRPQQARFPTPQRRIVSLHCTRPRPDRAQPPQVFEGGKPLRTNRTTFVRRTWDSLALKLNPVRMFILRQGTKVLVGAMLLAAAVAAHANYAPKSVPYSTFVQLLEERLILSASFEEDSAVVFFNVIPGAKRIQLDEQQQQQVQAQAPEQVQELELEDDIHLREAKMKLLKAEEELKATTTPSGAAGLVLAKLSQGLRVVKEKLPPPEYEYRTRRIVMDEQNLLNLIKYKSSEVQYNSVVTWTSFARTAGRALINFSIPLSALISLMHLRVTGDIFKRKPKKSSSQSIRFEDVAGVDSAKAELQELVSCLKGNSNFRSLGAQIPKGLLLVGPPGTGKTLLARALAGEAGIPFFPASASEFVEVYVGKGAARVRDLFETARKNAPSIIFIDEIDAVGGKRGRAFNDEKDQTLNQLLTNMDGFEGETGVIVIAATNRVESLDPALCRPGRFSRKVYVAEPDYDGRKHILAVHMRDVPVSGDAAGIRHDVAAMTAGFVGADLANVVNEAALLAARRGQSTVTAENFKEAVHRAKNGINGSAGGDSSQSETSEPDFEVYPAIAQ